MPLPLGASTQPSWVLPGAYADCDYINNRYFAGGAVVDQNANFNKLSLCSNSGAYGALSAINPYTPTRSGILYQGKQSQHRITDLGMFAERASQNYCLWSRDLTNAVWTATSCTAAKTATSTDNLANTASTVTASGANATILQTVTPSSRIYQAAIAVAGTGYVANETVTLAGGTFSAVGKVKVLTVLGGVPQTLNVPNIGAYTVLPANPVLQGSTTGVGVGLTVNLTFESFVFSAWVKRRTGSGSVFMTTDGGSTLYDITSQLSTTNYTWVTGMSQTNGASTYSCGFKLATNTDAIDIDFCQFEPVVALNNAVPFLPNPTGGMPTTPMITTSASTGRGNELAYWMNAAVIGTSGNAGQNIFYNVFSSNAPWAMAVSFNGDCTNNSTNGPSILASDMTCPTGYAGGGGSPVGPGAAQTANSGSNGRLSAGGTWNVVVVRCNKKGTYSCLNGGQVAGPNTTSPIWLPNANVGSTHFATGSNGSGTTDTQLNGSIGRMTFFDRDLSDAEMVNFSDPAFGYGTY